MITLNPQPTEFDGEELFVLEGTIADLQVAPTKENLLEQIQQGSKGKAALVGAVAGLAGVSQIVATSSALVFYDGEDTNNFAALIKGKGVVCGTFKAADSFVEGEQIKCVVSKRGDVYFAHAVLRVKAQAIMVPTMTFSGDRAYFRDLMNTGGNIMLFGMVFFGGFFAWASVSREGPLDWGLIATFLILIVVVAPLAGFGMEYWNYNSTKHWGLHASAVFRVLGVPRPDDFTLSGHWRAHLPSGTYCYESALKAHEEKYKDLTQQKP